MSPSAAPTSHPWTPGRRWARSDTRALARLLAVVAALHLIGWGVLGLVVVPHEFSVGEQVFGWGLGLTAYLFGVRHAFDADHIAVIDGATRQLTGSLTHQDRRPISVGFWFSLGHSSIVFAMAVVVATGARFAGSLVTEGSTADELLGTFGTTAAGVFLWVIGLVNLATLLGIARTARQRRRGGSTTSRFSTIVNVAIPSSTTSVPLSMNCATKHPSRLDLHTAVGNQTVGQIKLSPVHAADPAICWLERQCCVHFMRNVLRRFTRAPSTRTH